MLSSQIMGLLFVIWVLWQAYLGYKNGFWATVLNIVGFVLAYAISALYGAGFTDALSFLKIPMHLQLVVGYLSLFLLVSNTVRYVPLMIWRDLLEKKRKTVIYAVMLGAGSGLISGLVAIWFVGFLGAAISLQSSDQPEELSVAGGTSPRTNIAIQNKKKSGFLEKTASALVAGSTEIGLNVIGAGKHEAHAVSALMKDPQYVIDNTRQLIRSQELRAFILSPNIQKMMAVNDVGRVLASREFQALLTLPSAKQLLDVYADNEALSDGSEYFIAEKFTFVWRRLKYLKSDPRVKEIVNDPHFNASLREQNPAKLMSNPKFQTLVQIVMERGVNIDDMDFSHLVNESLDPVPEIKPARAIYKWTDSSGETKYSDENSVPDEYKARAQKIN